jgi:hypothetical protein
VGCGLGYVALVPILLLWGRAADVHSWPAAVVTTSALAINGPHYGATILRVYARREDRAKYRLFTVYATLLVIAWFAVGTHGGIAASALITAYLTWSPWHFSGQNYGIGVMFLRRRGVDVDPQLKRLFWLTFALSALLAIIQIHGTSGEYFEWRPTADAAGAPRLLKLGIHGVALQVLSGIVGTAYVGCLLAVALRLRKAVPFRGSGTGVGAGRDAVALVRDPGRAGARRASPSLRGDVGVDRALGAVPLDHGLLREAIGCSGAGGSFSAGIVSRRHERVGIPGPAVLPQSVRSTSVGRRAGDGHVLPRSTSITSSSMARSGSCEMVRSRARCCGQHHRTLGRSGCGAREHGASYWAHRRSPCWYR